MNSAVQQQDIQNFYWYAFIHKYTELRFTAKDQKVYDITTVRKYLGCISRFMVSMEMIKELNKVRPVFEW